MNDKHRTKKQLISELARLRDRIAVSERSDTERKEAEEALRESEERYRSLFENAFEAFLLTTPDGAILAANPEACRLLGWTEEELVRIGREGVVDVADPRLTPTLLEREQTGRARTELTFIRKDGTRFEGAVSSSVFKDRNGKPRTSIFIVDTTESKKTGEALREYEKVVEGSQDMIAVIDRSYRHRLINETCLRYRDARKEDFIGRSCEEALGRDLFEHTVKGYLDRCFLGETIQYEIKVTYPRLGERDMLVSYFPIKGSRGIDRVAAIMRDISENKKFEETLRLAIGATDLGIWDYYPQTGKLECCENVKQHFGLPPGAHVDFDVFMSGIHPDDRERVMAHIDKMLLPDSKEENYLEYRTRGICDGKERWVAAWTHAFFDKKGEPVRFIGATLDITERKRMEEELRKSHDELELRVAERTAALARLAAALDSATESIFITDSLWQIEYANPAFYDITGYTSDEVIGREMRFLRAEKEVSSVYDRSRQAAINGKPFAYRYTVRRKDGTAFPIESVKSAVKDALGETRNYVIVWRDMSEQLRLEEQLRQSHKMEAIGTLAGGIAHDFNNMLAVIIGNAELALDDVGEEGPRQNLIQILNASKRSRDLIKQILTFSRRGGRQAKAVKIAPLLRETCDLLRASLPSSIHMELKVQAKTDITLMADPSQIQQVVVNIANNAAYAMREDGGKLTIGLSSITIGSDSVPDENMKPGHYVKLTIKDIGAGIAAEVKSRMFEPFFTTKEQGQGTGMGLAVVYGIVKSCGGAVEVDSEVGKGSKFTVLLPQADDSSPMEEEKEEASSSPRKEHILFVDDEPAVVEMIKKMLERMGCRVTALTDGSEALKVFMENPNSFDLIITDQTMPDMTGVALAQKVLAVRKDMSIILCTGYSEMVSPEKAQEIGIREFVMKPITKKDMAQAISRVSEQKETEKQRANR